MEIIDRYIYEVGRHLPRRIRADVQVELRSLLEEALEEKARAAERPADSPLAAQVLREFGPPQEVAARYHPPRQYLIGPRLYPTYMLIAKIVLIVLAAVFAGMVVVAAVAARGPAAPLSAGRVFALMWSFISSGLMNLAILTLVIAIVERVQIRPEAEPAAWHPGMLPPVDDPDQISQAGLVLAMYAILAFAVVFNFYPEWIGIVGFHQGRASWHLPLLRAEFAMHMPLINLWWALDFGLCLAVLRHGRWRRGTRWAEFGLGLLGAAILWVIFTGPEAFRFDYIIKAILKGLFIIVLIESGLRLYRLLTRRPFEPWRISESPASRERAG